MAFRIHKLAAISYVLWGLHAFVLGTVFLLLSLFGPADAFASTGIPADTSPHARALMMQNNVSFAVAGLIVLVAAVRLAWTSPTRGYWVLLGISSLFTFETVAFELAPGYLTLKEVGAYLALWALASTLATVAYIRARSSPGTATADATP